MKYIKNYAPKALSAVLAATILFSGCAEKEKINDSAVFSTSDTAGNSRTESSGTSLPSENSETSSVSSVNVSEPTAEASSAAVSSSEPVVSSSSSAASSSKPGSSSSSSADSSSKPVSSSSSSTALSSKPVFSSSSSTASSSKPVFSSSSSAVSSSKPVSSSSSSAFSSSKPVSSSSSSAVSSSKPVSSSSSSSSQSTVSTPETKPGLDENEIYKILISFKEKYPEGTSWTNETRSYKSYSIYPQYSYYEGRGCAAFALELSDAAFGKLPGVQHNDISKIRVGDMIRINGDTHSAIVLEVNSTDIVIAEGNYNKSVHWERKISNSELEQSLTYIVTRYPQ